MRIRLSDDESFVYLINFRSWNETCRNLKGNYLCARRKRDSSPFHFLLIFFHFSLFHERNIIVYINNRFSSWNLLALKMESFAYSTLPLSFSSSNMGIFERYHWSSGNDIFAGGRKQEVDRFGYYQMIMFAIISLPLFLSAGFTLAYVFTAGEVKYRYVTTDATCDSTGDIYFFFSFIFSLYIFA